MSGYKVTLVNDDGRVLFDVFCNATYLVEVIQLALSIWPREHVKVEETRL